MRIKKYTDIDAIFAPHPITGDVSTRKDDRAIKFAIKSLVLTNVFERPFHSEIGSPVPGLLFDNFSNNFEILMKEAIAQLIEQFEPRVDLMDVEVFPSHDNNSVYIKISFKIKNTLQTLEVGFTMDRTR